MGKLEDFCRKAIELGAAKAKIIKAEDVIVAEGATISPFCNLLPWKS
ncbi:unnamed protein product [marine sediment metagenome]|uniref:Uncharacterized protein n=1 Tax=marine sediment metagenome TaxID=412755 RepID=X1V769_9ZZZZ